MTGKLVVNKILSALPAVLEPNAIYLVRAGTGFSLYVADSTGQFAHSLNSAGSKLTYRANSSSFPTGSVSGDWLIVTSDGTRSGTIKEQWLFDGNSWTLVQGAYPVSGSVLENTIANSASVTIVGRYIVPATGLLGVFVGHANQFADWDGTTWTFTTPADNTTVFITSGTNTGTTWKYLTASGWSAVPVSSKFSAPLPWALPNAYSAGDIVQRDKIWWKANNNIPANTSFTSGTSGTTWSKLLSEGIYNGTLTTGTTAAESVLGAKSSRIVIETGAGLQPLSLYAGPSMGVGFYPYLETQYLITNNSGVAIPVLKPGGGLICYVGIGDAVLIEYVATATYKILMYVTAKSQLTIATTGGTTSLAEYNDLEVELSGPNGQKVKLPDATKLRVGARISIKNNTSITGACNIQNNSATDLLWLGRRESVVYVLKSNTTAPGVWVVDSYTRAFMQLDFVSTGTEYNLLSNVCSDLNIVLTGVVAQTFKCVDTRLLQLGSTITITNITTASTGSILKDFSGNTIGTINPGETIRFLLTSNALAVGSWSSTYLTQTARSLALSTNYIAQTSSAPAVGDSLDVTVGKLQGSIGQLAGMARYTQSIAISANKTSTTYNFSAFKDGNDTTVTLPTGVYFATVARSDINIAWRLSGFLYRGPSQTTFVTLDSNSMSYVSGSTSGITINPNTQAYPDTYTMACLRIL